MHPPHSSSTRSPPGHRYLDCLRGILEDFFSGIQLSLIRLKSHFGGSDCIGPHGSCAEFQ